MFEVRSSGRLDAIFKNLENTLGKVPIKVIPPARIIPLESVLALAIEALSWVELEDVSPSSALTRAAKQLEIIDAKMIAEASLLVRDSLCRRNFIDRVIDLALAPASMDDFDLGTQSFLRVFVLKTKFNLKRVEEAAELVKAGRSVLGEESLTPVEEVFGKILRIDTEEVLSGLDDHNRLGIQTFHPEWFVKYCIHLMGRREALRLLSYSAPSPRCMGINTLKGSEEEILREISSFDIVLDKVRNLPYLYRVVHGTRMLTGLEVYAKGLFSLQDESSCLAAILGEPQTGHVILDVGARPVNKTIYLAQLMNNRGKILSMDSSARRIRKLECEAERTGVEIIEPMVVETDDAPIMGEKADTVLLSPRCSGTGVFWREPSLKWRVDFKRVGAAADAQWRMINRYADYVRDGGSLVYWTNSVTIEENEMLIERFLKLHPEFSLTEARPHIGVPALRGQRECQRLYPHLHEADGSYFARLVKDW